MIKQTVLRSAAMAVLVMVGCAKPTGEQTPPDAAGDGAQRPSLTSAECEAKGGKIVGDIGDGAIHRPDYKCENGEPPLGSITPSEGEPIAVEGSVCCPT